jgi:septum site-determining protein MinC
MDAHGAQTSVMKFGARSLLAFVLEPQEPLSQWFESLDAWLTRSPNFFASKAVILQMGGMEIRLKNYRDLLADLARRRIRVMAVENPSRGLVGPHLPPIISDGRNANAAKLLDETSAAAKPPPQPAASTPVPPASASLIIETNVRSGQSIEHFDGDVTVVGRIASGAEIIAGGSVHVYGALQGRIIAGVSGGPGARIFCKEMRAELLCIGGAYVTAEEMNPAIEGKCVEVRLDGNELSIRSLD